MTLSIDGGGTEDGDAQNDCCKSKWFHDDPVLPGAEWSKIATGRESAGSY